MDEINQFVPHVNMLIEVENINFDIDSIKVGSVCGMKYLLLN